MNLFVPDRAYFESGALEHPIGQEILAKLKDLHVEIMQETSHNRITNLLGANELQEYRAAKRTIGGGRPQDL